MSKLINKIFICLTLLTSILIVGCNKDKNSHEHKFSDATCTTPATCKECGETTGSVIEHNYSNWQTLDATCVSEGMMWRNCLECNKLEQVVLSKTGHSYGEWTEVKEATYTSQGSEKRICKNCPEFEERPTPTLDPTPLVEKVIQNLEIPSQTMTNIELPTLVEGVSISWKTSDIDVISANGEIGKRTANNQRAILRATFTLGGVVQTKDYNITLLGFTNEEKLEIVMNSLSFPEELTSNLTLDTSLSYGVKATYSSSNTTYLSNEGVIDPQDTDVNVTLTVVLTLGSDSIDKKFNFTILKYTEPIKYHQLIEYADDFNMSNQTGLEIKNNRLVLKDGVTEATYYSDEIATNGFTSLVGSWAAISSTTSTCELFVSVKVGSTWSGYITYGKWGLGLQNAATDQSNSIIELSTDEVNVLNNQKGVAIKYKVVLRRTSTSVDSPALSLVSFALEIPNYSYYVKTSLLPDYVCYDVPKLYQQVVPTIGNSICSATSTTMMLKYKGLSFTDKDSEYEHRYMASIVRDYGNKIYGNWVYNTAAMGGYGFNAYVARMYSVDELRYYLANYGPVALTVKGTMVSSEKTYTTNGHLIVAIGYKYVNNQLYIICNDPNVANVYCEYSLTVINNTWRMVAYVME